MVARDRRVRDCMRARDFVDKVEARVCALLAERPEEDHPQAAALRTGLARLSASYCSVVPLASLPEFEHHADKLLQAFCQFEGDSEDAIDDLLEFFLCWAQVGQEYDLRPYLERNSPAFFQQLVRQVLAPAEERRSQALFLIVQLTAMHGDWFIDAFEPTAIAETAFRLLSSGAPSSALLDNTLIFIGNVFASSSVLIGQFVAHRRLLDALFMLNLQADRPNPEALCCIRNFLRNTELPEVEDFLYANVDLIDSFFDLLLPDQTAQIMLIVANIIRSCLRIGAAWQDRGALAYNFVHDQISESAHHIERLTDAQKHPSPVVREAFTALVAEFFDFEVQTTTGLN